VKYCLLAILATAALAQSVSKTYTTDINGNRVETPAVESSDHTRTEVTQNLNGRKVPLEQVEERVIRQDGNTKVTERIVRKFDASGQPVLTDRQMIEEQKRPDGVTTNVTTYRTNLNGREQEAERATTVQQIRGNVTQTESTVARPTINGSFETVQKSTAVAEKTPAGTREDQTTYQRGENGGFVVSAREVKETSQTGNKSTENRTLYQPFGADGQMRVTEQSVSETVKQPDGAELVQKTIYGPSWTGNVGSAEAGPQLREQDLIERKPGPGGTVVESTSVSRPTPSNPNKLSPPTKISETVCTGNCKNP
jgi:hypothetical protein